MKIPLTKIRNSRRLTVYGWLLLFFCLIIFICFWAVTIHGFLAQNKPVNSQTLVIEGYVPDSVIDSVACYIESSSYERIVCAGLPLIKGRLCTEYDNYADYNAACLLDKGLDPARVISAPTERTTTDRTYATALSVKEKLSELGFTSGNINIVCSGTHGRRSRILYKKALKPDWNVGVISFSDSLYDPKAWWKTSEGVRGVVYEMFAYLYCAVFFHP